MITITFIQDSFLKSKPLQSVDLKDEEKMLIKKGQTISGTGIRLGSHCRLTLDSTSKPNCLNNSNIVYFYTPHTSFLRDTKSLSKKGLELIKEFEGCKLSSYICPSGVWTIGKNVTLVK